MRAFRVATYAAGMTMLAAALEALQRALPGRAADAASWLLTRVAVWHALGVARLAPPGPIDAMRVIATHPMFTSTERAAARRRLAAIP